MQTLTITFVILIVLAVICVLFKKQWATLFNKSSTFLKEVNMEMSKVTWPTKNEIISYTVVVLVTVIIIAIIIGIEDFFLGKLLDQFLKSAV